MPTLHSMPPKKRTGENRKVPTRQERFETAKSRLLWLGRAIFWLSVTAGAAACALFGGRAGLQYLKTSPTFALREIRIDGDVGDGAPLGADELRNRSGLTLGTNIFELALPAAQEKLEQLPWVRNVWLERELPGSVHIRVEQRRAIAYVDLTGLYLVDEHGQVFKRSTPEDTADLPVITGLSRQDFISGSPELRDRLEISLALVAPPPDNRLPWEPSELSEIHWDHDLGLSLELGSTPTTVELGFPPFDEKLERLRRTRSELSRRGLHPSALYLDDSRQKDQVGMALAGVDPLADTATP